MKNKFILLLLITTQFIGIISSLIYLNDYLSSIRHELQQSNFATGSAIVREGEINTNLTYLIYILIMNTVSLTIAFILFYRTRKSDKA